MKHTTIEAVAYHEAGHAVVGYRYRNWIRAEGVRVDKAAIRAFRPSASPAGWVDQKMSVQGIDAYAIRELARQQKQPEIWRHYQQRVEWEIAALQAGPLAEWRRLGKRLDGLLESDDWQWEPGWDHYKTRMLAAYVGAAQRGSDHPDETDWHGDSTSLLLWMIQQQTARLLRRAEVWRAVQRLARELARHGHVAADKTERIIAGAGVRQISERAWFGPTIKTTTISGSAATAARRAGRAYSRPARRFNAGIGQREQATPQPNRSASRDYPRRRA